MKSKNTQLGLFLFVNLLVVFAFSACNPEADSEDKDLPKVDPENQNEEEVDSEDSGETNAENTNSGPIFESGETVVITKSEDSWFCLPLGDPCEDFVVTTEVDLTEPSDGQEFTGQFFVRAYDGEDLENSQLMDEFLIYQNRYSFAGDGGDVPQAPEDREEILTVRAAADFSKNAQKLDKEFIASLYKEKFYLEFVSDDNYDYYFHRNIHAIDDLDSVPEADDEPGYFLFLENEGETNEFYGSYIYFVYKSGELSINVPQ